MRIERGLHDRRVELDVGQQNLNLCLARVALVADDVGETVCDRDRAHLLRGECAGAAVRVQTGVPGHDAEQGDEDEEAPESSVHDDRMVARGPAARSGTMPVTRP